MLYIHPVAYKWVAAPPRPTPIPVLVGSDTFGRVQSGIPTQRPGPRGMLQGMDTGPAIEAPVPRMNVKGIESTRYPPAEEPWSGDRQGSGGTA